MGNSRVLNDWFLVTNPCNITKYNLTSVSMLKSFMEIPIVFGCYKQ